MTTSATRSFALRDALELDELHLTGGEPTLHPGVARLTAIATEAGFRVGMTSNGERGERVIPDCAEAGLGRVNFSIFGTTAAELAEVQHSRYRNPVLAQRKLEALALSIAACDVNGVDANANLVVPDYTHAPPVHRLLDEHSPRLTVRLLNSLDGGQTSIEAISRILADRGAVAESLHITAGASGARTAYRLPDGRRIFFKQIRPVRLPGRCPGCRFNNGTDCEEGFYGVRLYYDRTGTFQVGVCIQRMDLCLPLSDFLSSPYAARSSPCATPSTTDSPPGVPDKPRCDTARLETHCLSSTKPRFSASILGPPNVASSTKGNQARRPVHATLRLRHHPRR